jgi:hypothetical protein
MDEARYSVRCDYDDSSHKYVRQDATVDEAVEAFGFYVHCFSARIGTLQRVTVLNGDGMVSLLEWNFGKGITRKPLVGLKVDAGVPASEHV